MRLNLYWRGYDVIDVEVHLWKLREDDDEDDSGDSQEDRKSEIAFGFGTV